MNKESMLHILCLSFLTLLASNKMFQSSGLTTSTSSSHRHHQHIFVLCAAQRPLYPRFSTSARRWYASAKAAPQPWAEKDLGLSIGQGRWTVWTVDEVVGFYWPVIRNEDYHLISSANSWSVNLEHLGGFPPSNILWWRRLPGRSEGLVD